MGVHAPRKLSLSTSMLCTFRAGSVSDRSSPRAIFSLPRVILSHQSSGMSRRKRCPTNARHFLLWALVAVWHWQVARNKGLYSFPTLFEPGQCPPAIQSGKSCLPTSAFQFSGEPYTPTFGASRLNSFTPSDVIFVPSISTPVNCFIPTSFIRPTSVTALL